MPSFSTIFAVAATAFAAFSSAAPTGPAPGVNQVSQVLGVSDTLNNVAQNVDVHHVNVQGVNVAPVQGIQPAKRDGVLGGLLDGLTGSIGSRDEEAKSLPTILVSVKAELDALLADVSAVVDGKVDVDIEILKPIIGKVAVIIAGAVVKVKVLIGHPADFILSLDGKVLAVVDVCHLLVSVLVTVHAILALCLHVVAKVDLQVCASLVAHVGAIVAQLLVVIFIDLKVGIFAAIGSILTPAFLEALAVIKLDAVVAVLKNGHA